MITNNLIVYLPFDNSATTDSCGNTWTAYNSPTISTSNAFNGNALQLDGSYTTNNDNGQYLSLDGGITLGGDDFTITGWSFMDSSIGKYARLLAIFNSFGSNGNKSLRLENNGSGNLYLGYDGSSTSSADVRGTLFHFAVVYQHSLSLLSFYVNGNLIGTINKSVPKTNYTYCYLGRANYKASDTYYYKGTIDDFSIYDGIALYTTDFTPPTSADYSTIDFVWDFDTKRKITGNYVKTQWIQPVLTSNDSNSALIVSSGGGADSTAYRAFDSSLSSYVNRTNADTWIQFVTAALIEIHAINISSPDSCLPGSGVLQVSYDGTTWENVGTWADTLGTGETADVVFNDDYPVGRYFRLLSQGRSLAKPSSNADIGNITITAMELGAPSTDIVVDLDCDTKRSIRNIVTADFDTCRQVLSNSLSIEFDTLRIVKQKWRYENYGTADLLSVSGTTVTDLPISQSLFKSAFYQTQRAKCFDIPATNELWVKFDVYSDNNYSWRAYNQANSNYVDGIRSNSDLSISFWSSSSSDSSVYSTPQQTIEYVFYNVLLHMVSGSSNGIIEAWLDGNLLYSYTGNVNNGNDFENFYLQSAGRTTYFSNVIISNSQINLNENATADYSVEFDTLRQIGTTKFSFDENFDTCLQINKSITLNADTKRQVVKSIGLDCETYRKVERSVSIDCDVLRAIPYPLVVDPVNSSGVAIDMPQTTGIQSININISAGTLIDQLTIVTVNDVDILDVVKGQYLDYIYDYRIESLSRRGMLSTCKCCSNLDNLLYTQIAYTLSKTTWNGGLYKKTSTPKYTMPSATVTDDEDENEEKIEMINKPVARAREHVCATAGRLGLTAVCLFSDFNSTLDIEQEGVTYQDIISQVFGWSQRVPHKQINVYIRGKFLYVIERGHEQYTINIDNADIGKDFTIQRQLIRTSYGVTRKTTNLEKPDGWDSELDIGDEIVDEEPEEPEEPEEEEKLKEPEKPTRNLPRYEVTTEGNVVTEVWYEYDSDDNIIRTTTITTSGKLGGKFSYANVAAGGFVSNQVVVSNEYTTMNGEKLLANEITKEYEMKTEINTARDPDTDEIYNYATGEWILVDQKTIHHEYTTVGQQHITSASSDGNINGSVTTPARREDRPTPYGDKKNQALAEEQAKQQQTEYDDNGERKWGGSYTYINGKKYKTYGYISTPRTITGTLEEVLLYDSSFPVDDNKAQSITNELKWLNRAIQETVTLDIYNYPHVFDLNNKIVWQGKTYHLQSNNITRTPNITNKQTLELVRWYKKPNEHLITAWIPLKTWTTVRRS